MTGVPVPAKRWGVTTPKSMTEVQLFYVNDAQRRGKRRACSVD